MQWALSAPKVVTPSFVPASHAGGATATMHGTQSTTFRRTATPSLVLFNFQQNPFINRRYIVAALVLGDITFIGAPSASLINPFFRFYKKYSLVPDNLVLQEKHQQKCKSRKHHHILKILPTQMTANKHNNHPSFRLINFDENIEQPSSSLDLVFDSSRHPNKHLEEYHFRCMCMVL